MADDYAITRFEDYANKWQTVRMERRNGILQLTMHTNGGPLAWGELPHRELPQAFAAIAADRENRVVILTGTGDAFIPEIDMDSVRFTMQSPLQWHKQVWEGTKLLLNLLDIQVPVIAAVNGPATTHSELAVLCDIVLASENALFADQPHFWNGLVPGDGIALVWQQILGPNRGRYFLLTGQQIRADEALRLGVVNEVLPQAELLDRAWAIAEEIAKRPTLALFYTKYLLTVELKRLLNNHAYYGLVLEGAALVEDRGKDLGLAKRTAGFDAAVGFDRKAQ
jgi:enoyl-CoA hydratase/carnithine racemase